MTTIDLSVLTLVRGRREHLMNMMRGLARQIRKPRELVIAWMADEPHVDLPALPFPVRHVMVPGDPMPLAAARNRAAETATSENLVFLDVDCIPSPMLCATYGDALSSDNALFLSEVLYLEAHAVGARIDYARLDRTGIPHPAKPFVPENGRVPEPDHGELWGLCFGIRRSRWQAVGGMDERFYGYGGEETDLAEKLRAAGVPLYWLGGARAYHQHHVVHVPPLHHFEHIVRNAQLFFDKWRRFPMSYWLGQFADMGLVKLRSDSIEVLRLPTPTEISATKMPGDVRFS
ncbi:MAG: galactosyltransferase-related protein [Pacificimonas sp.]